MSFVVFILHKTRTKYHANDISYRLARTEDGKSFVAFLARRKVQRDDTDT